MSEPNRFVTTCDIESLRLLPNPIMEISRMLRKADLQELESWISAAIQADIGESAPATDADLAKQAAALGYWGQRVTGPQIEGEHQIIRCGARTVATRHLLPPMNAF